jgi:glycosyltransferase involved in cell wall biosynthesis
MKFTNTNIRQKIKIGIDASRNRSGGAKAHIIGILNEVDEDFHFIKEVHIWSYKSLLDSLPNRPWLIKHNPPELEASIFKQVLWQYTQLPKEAKFYNCDIMLYTDAGAFINFHPCIVMSRDMLSYEKGEMQRFGFSVARIRLILLKYIQAFSMKKANAVIFLTKYAANVIQNFTGKLPEYFIINHGVGNEFRINVIPKLFFKSGEVIKCIYISNTSMYKHQWHVIRAIKILREQGFNLKLLLVGGGKGKAQKVLQNEILKSDPTESFITQMEFVKNKKLPYLLANSDIFIFASSCENMPNTLVEGMSSGLPIACSNRGPMPEVLKNGGVYFNPENPQSIANSIANLLLNNELRIQLSICAKELSFSYSWKRCADETFDYLNLIASRYHYTKN